MMLLRIYAPVSCSISQLLASTEPDLDPRPNSRSHRLHSLLRTWRDYPKDRKIAMSQSSKTVRRITGLLQVELSSSPWPKTSHKGSKAKGLSFERKVGKELIRQMATGELKSGKLHSGTWLKYLDRNGPGFAQPDHFILYSDLILLLECKLKQNTQAEDQLQILYRPL